MEEKKIQIVETWQVGMKEKISKSYNLLQEVRILKAERNVKVTY